MSVEDRARVWAHFRQVIEAANQKERDPTPPIGALVGLANYVLCDLNRIADAQERIATAQESIAKSLEQLVATTSDES